LLSISLEVVNASSISVNSLLEFRDEKTQFTAELRHIAEAVESYIDQLAEPDLKPSDVATCTKNFNRACKWT
jgi:hypothetical protein